MKTLGEALPDLLPFLPVEKARRAAADAQATGQGKPRPLTRVQRRVLEKGRTPEQDDDPDSLAYQHSVFCQTGLPYRDPGDDVRLWERTQGAAALEIQAGRLRDPLKGRFVDVGLPWGTKSRLVLAHINGEALRQGTNVIEIEGSLTAFVKRIRGFTGGREIRLFKDHLNRLSASIIRLAFDHGKHRASQIDTKIISACDLWLTKDERQRVLWPSTIALSLDYFESLQQHAVPLNEADLAALAHSAMALDIYAWLAQRLHRIDPARPQFIPWHGVKQQFGQGYDRMDHFKAAFRKALRQVVARYLAARIDEDGHGLTLRHSPPPVLKSTVLLPRKP